MVPPKFVAVHTGPTNGVVKSLHQPLAKQLARFTFTFETEEQKPAILAALDWSASDVTG